MCRHDGRGRTSLLSFVDSTVRDFHALQIFLNQFFADHLNVLFRFAAGSFPNPIGCMFLDQYPDLFCQIGSRGQFRDPLADELSFGKITLAVTDERVLLDLVLQLFERGSGGRRIGNVGPAGSDFCGRATLFLQALKGFVGMALNRRLICPQIFGQDDSSHRNNAGQRDGPRPHFPPPSIHDYLPPPLGAPADM
jgi:hypothetical protein